jgi:hypothetical protein
VSYDNTAKSYICTVYTIFRTSAGRSADYSCNPDFNVAQVGVVTRWTPVKNLTFSGEVMWFGLDQKFTGSAILTPTAPKPTALYEYKDQNAVSLNVRVQRNF